MKKIFWRVFVYFGLVLLLFSVLIGLMFTRFNSTNIVGAYKQQLGDLATGVASRTSKAVSNKEEDTFPIIWQRWKISAICRMWISGL